MFCALTRPLPDATTDFGEIAPLIVRNGVRRRVSEGVDGLVVVVVVLDVVVDAVVD